jgi:hypothetical protein
MSLCSKILHTSFPQKYGVSDVPTIFILKFQNFYFEIFPQKYIFGDLNLMLADDSSNFLDRRRNYRFIHCHKPQHKKN